MQKFHTQNKKEEWKKIVKSTEFLFIVFQQPILNSTNFFTISYYFFLKSCNFGLWGKINSTQALFSVLISIKSFYQIVECKQILKKMVDSESRILDWFVEQNVMNKILVKIPTGSESVSDRIQTGKIKKYQSKMKQGSDEGSFFQPSAPPKVCD